MVELAARKVDFGDFSQLIYIALVVVLPALAALGRKLRKKFGDKDAAAGEKPSPVSRARKGPQRPKVPERPQQPREGVPVAPPARRLPTAKPIPGRVPSAHPGIPAMPSPDAVPQRAQRPRPAPVQPPGAARSQPPHASSRGSRGLQLPQPAARYDARSVEGELSKSARPRIKRKRPKARQAVKTTPEKLLSPAELIAKSKPVSLIRPSKPVATAKKVSRRTRLIPRKLTAGDMRSAVVLSEILKPPLGLRHLDDWSG